MREKNCSNCNHRFITNAIKFLKEFFSVAIQGAGQKLAGCVVFPNFSLAKPKHTQAVSGGTTLSRLHSSFSPFRRPPQPDRASAVPSRSTSRWERAAREPRRRARHTWAAPGSGTGQRSPAPARRSAIRRRRERTPEPRDSERIPGPLLSPFPSAASGQRCGDRGDTCAASRGAVRLGGKLNPAPGASAGRPDPERHRQRGGRRRGAGAAAPSDGGGDAPAGASCRAGGAADTYLCSAHHGPCHAAGWPRRGSAERAGPLPGRVSWRGRKRGRAGGAAARSSRRLLRPGRGRSHGPGRPRGRLTAGGWRGPRPAWPGHGHPCPAAAPLHIPPGRRARSGTQRLPRLTEPARLEKAF